MLRQAIQFHVWVVTTKAWCLCLWWCKKSNKERDQSNMFPAAVMSNSTSLSGEASVSSVTRVHDLASLNPMVSTISHHQPQKIKKKRNLPGNPDPDAEVIALSPKTLLATNRFVCEICNKGFQRDQNLQLHRRGHNLPWKLKQRNSKENRKKAYVCPEPSCVHHNPSRALGDLTGIKKHFCRKHGEKKWKCEKCSKIYAVQSDWKAHSKTCGTREYRCDCGTLFSRKDSFITHRAFCDALAEESARLTVNQFETTTNPIAQPFHHLLHPQPQNPPPPHFPFSSIHHHQHFPNPPAQQHIHISLNPWEDTTQNPIPTLNQNPLHIKPETTHLPMLPPPPISSSSFFQEPQPLTHKNLVNSPYRNLPTSSNNATSSAHLSATALLQKATIIGHVGGRGTGMSPQEYLSFASGNLATWQKSDRLTRDFLGLTGECGGGNGGGGSVDANVNVRNMLSFTGGVEFPTYERDHSLLKAQGFGFGEPAASETWGNC
ncbi:unnamed protein product [Camellia sinensis]